MSFTLKDRLTSDQYLALMFSLAKHEDQQHQRMDMAKAMKYRKGVAQAKAKITADKAEAKAITASWQGDHDMDAWRWQDDGGAL